MVQADCMFRPVSHKCTVESGLEDREEGLIQKQIGMHVRALVMVMERRTHTSQTVLHKEMSIFRWPVGCQGQEEGGA